MDAILVMDFIAVSHQGELDSYALHSFITRSVMTTLERSVMNTLRGA